MFYDPPLKLRSNIPSYCHGYRNPKKIYSAKVHGINEVLTDDGGLFHEVGTVWDVNGPLINMNALMPVALNGPLGSSDC